MTDSLLIQLEGLFGIKGGDGAEAISLSVAQLSRDDLLTAEIIHSGSTLRLMRKSGETGNVAVFIQAEYKNAIINYYILNAVSESGIAICKPLKNMYLRILFREFFFCWVYLSALYLCIFCHYSFTIFAVREPSSKSSLIKYIPELRLLMLSGN